MRGHAPSGSFIVAHLHDDNFAHPVHNVNFSSENVNAHSRANRSPKAWRRSKNAYGPHCLGDRFYCLGDRKSCNRYSVAHIAASSDDRRRLFLRAKSRIFDKLNQGWVLSLGFCNLLTKSVAPCLRYFRARGWPVGFAGILEVNECEMRDCTR